MVETLFVALGWEAGPSASQPAPALQVGLHPSCYHTFAKNNAKTVPKIQRDKGEIREDYKCLPGSLEHPNSCILQLLPVTYALCKTGSMVTNLLLPSRGSGCSREACSGSSVLTGISETSTEPSNLQGLWVNITSAGLGVPFRLWDAACTTNTS